MISQYIRDSKRNKRGMLVAEQNQFSGKITIGWSLCNKKDKFDKDRALYIATGRAVRNRRTITVNDVYTYHIVPDAVKKEIRFDFIDRVARYFKMDWRDIEIA